MNIRLQVLLVEIARHASSYAELGAAAAGEYRREVIRRALMGGIGAVTGIVALVAVWGAGLVAVWDTQWRTLYAVAAAVLLVAVAGTAFYLAFGPRPSGRAVASLRDELQKDKELFRQWKSTQLP